MLLRIDHTGHCGVIQLAGRLDGDDLVAVLEAVGENPRKPWALDLTRMESLDADGVAALLAMGGRATADRLRLGLIVAPGPMADAVAVAELALSVPVFGSVGAFVEEWSPEAALAADGPYAPEENPLALAARKLLVPAQT